MKHFIGQGQIYVRALSELPTAGIVHSSICTTLTAFIEPAKPKPGPEDTQGSKDSGQEIPPDIVVVTDTTDVQENEVKMHSLRCRQQLILRSE